MLRVHPIPQNEIDFEDVRVYINGEPAKLYCCRVSAMPFNVMWPGYQRPIEQTEIAGFISVDLSSVGECANISVVPREEVKECWVRPLSKKVHVSRGLLGTIDPCNEINFTLSKPGQYVLEMNDHHCPVMFFVNPIKIDEPGNCAGNLIHFGPGIHRPGRLRLHSRDTLWIESGAVVHTSVVAEDVKNIRIIGGGILDNSEFERPTGDLYCNTPIKLYNCENVEVSGIVIRDSSAFTLMGCNLRNVTIDNIKIVGNWRYNSDGIDLLASANVTIRNCFVRTFDDSISIKSWQPYDYTNTENWTISGCVIWCDWSHGIGLLDTRAKEFRNIVFSDCDIIHNQCCGLSICNNGSANIYNILFEDIRVEYKTSVTPSQYQKSFDQIYSLSNEMYFPTLLETIIEPTENVAFLCEESSPGKAHHVTFRNIEVILPPEITDIPLCVVKGYNDLSNVSNIIVDGVYVNGHRLTQDEANLTVNEFVSDFCWM